MTISSATTVAIEVGQAKRLQPVDTGIQSAKLGLGGEVVEVNAPVLQNYNDLLIRGIRNMREPDPRDGYGKLTLARPIERANKKSDRSPGS